MGVKLGLFESSIEFEATYPHPPERVWRALTESELLGAWLMENDLEPEVGQTFEFRADPKPPVWDGITRCEVLEVDAPRKLVISWWGGGSNPHTKVTWRLEAVEGGTRLTMEHTGLTGVRGLMMKMGMRGGWKTMYETLLPEVLRRLEAGEPVPSREELRDAA